MRHLLIVEDDAENNQMIAEYLESHGYKCTQAYSGSEGKLLFEREDFDLVLLDLMLPGIGGDELVSLFSRKTPVIVLSARSGLDSKVQVLSDGAEDYICKPFDLRELLVRIQVQLRRQDRRTEAGKESEANDSIESGRPVTMGQSIEARPENPKELFAGNSVEGGRPVTMGQSIKARPVNPEEPSPGDSMDGGQSRKTVQPADACECAYHYKEWTLNPDTWEMTAGGLPVILTKHEFLILELLIRNPKRVFSKRMIYEYAWGEEYLAEDKTINVHISNIRGKLKESGTDSYIQTVWGMGFKLC